MKDFSVNIRIQINDKVYLKDPESSDVGQKIITFGVDLMVELGYELFTFKKLALKIQSTEATIYRYFESKHMFLAYLIHWYWGWKEYRLMVRLANIDNPFERIKRAVSVFSESNPSDENIQAINTSKLRDLIISDSSKLYHNKEVDVENESGFFAPYKRIVNKLSEIVLEINPKYQFPQMLISTMIEGINHQRYFSIHLPLLTNVLDGKDAVEIFYQEMILKLITPEKL